MKYGWLPSVMALVALTVAVPARAVTSAELYRTEADVYGRFEARIRFAAGDGVVSSFFLWKSGSETAGAYWNELDFEKLGADCHLQTNALYGTPVVGHTQVNATAADPCGGYHTYGFEWAPTYIAWQIDGVEVRRDTGDTATAFAQNATAGMQIHFNIWPGDASFGGNFDPAILPVQQYISWVQYSSYSNGTFAQAWREEFDAASVPSGWATGDWASPKNLSTDSPANVSFAGGISILSLTADNTTGFSGTPPADAAVGGASGSTGGAGAAGAGAASGGAGTMTDAGSTGMATGGGANVGVGGMPSAASGGPNGVGGAVNVGAGAGGTGVSSGSGGTSPGGAPGAGSASSTNGTSSGCSCGVPLSRSRGGASALAIGLAALLTVRRRSGEARRAPGAAGQQ